MRKRVLALTLVLALVLGVSAQAAQDRTYQITPELTNVERDPEALYREYAAMVAEANERYDLEIVLSPLEDMDQDHMSTVRGMQADVDDLVDAACFMKKWQGGAEPNQVFFQRLFHGILTHGQPRGMGAKTVSVSTPVYAENLGMEWSLSPIFLVATVPGPSSYYMLKVRNADMTLEALPEGYEAVANGAAWVQRSPNLKRCTVSQQFTLHKNDVSVSVVPWVVFQVDKDSGMVSVDAVQTSDDM